MALDALFALALVMQQPADAPAEARPVYEAPIPPGAPTDDYGLVAWCYGALSGHMAMYDQVKPDLDALSNDPSRAELDSQQQAAGREYLALYQRALNTADAASPRSRRSEGERARASGEAIWGPARNAVDPKTRMWSWLMWELPGRCETAANRLQANADLSAPAVARPDAQPAPPPAG